MRVAGVAKNDGRSAHWWRRPGVYDTTMEYGPSAGTLARLGRSLAPDEVADLLDELARHVPGDVGGHQADRGLRVEQAVARVRLEERPPGGSPDEVPECPHELAEVDRLAGPFRRDFFPVGVAHLVHLEPEERPGHGLEEGEPGRVTDTAGGRGDADMGRQDLAGPDVFQLQGSREGDPEADRDADVDQGRARLPPQRRQ